MPHRTEQYMLMAIAGAAGLQQKLQPALRQLYRHVLAHTDARKPGIQALLSDTITSSSRLLRLQLVQQTAFLSINAHAALLQKTEPKRLTATHSAIGLLLLRLQRKLQARKHVSVHAADAHIRKKRLYHS